MSAAPDRHIHTCAAWKATGDCPGHPCRCACGAVQTFDYFQSPPRWSWQNPDGSLDPWPDPREAEAQ